MKELISKEQIQKRINELGNQITKDYYNQEITIIALLKGSFPFLADLIRQIKLKMQIEFIQVSSYGNNSKSSGTINIIRDLSRPIAGENILIVDDIIDTGLTLKSILNHLKLKQPKDMQIASLLIKPKKFNGLLKIKYSGFEIKDHFVVGMGMDYQGYFRNLDCVCSLENHELKENE